MLADELVSSDQANRTEHPSLYNTYKENIKQNRPIKNGFLQAKENLNREFKYLWQAFRGVMKDMNL
jgi:hypothetical protein